MLHNFIVEHLISELLATLFSILMYTYFLYDTVYFPQNYDREW